MKILNISETLNQHFHNEIKRGNANSWTISNVCLLSMMTWRKSTKTTAISQKCMNSTHATHTDMFSLHENPPGWLTLNRKAIHFCIWAAGVLLFILPRQQCLLLIRADESHTHQLTHFWPKRYSFSQHPDTLQRQALYKLIYLDT